MGWENKHLTAGDSSLERNLSHSVDPDFGDVFFPAENSPLSFGDGFPAVVDDLELWPWSFPKISRNRGIPWSPGWRRRQENFCRRF